MPRLVLVMGIGVVGVVAGLIFFGRGVSSEPPRPFTDVVIDEPHVADESNVWDADECGKHLEVVAFAAFLREPACTKVGQNRGGEAALRACSTTVEKLKREVDLRMCPPECLGQWILQCP